MTPNIATDTSRDFPKEIRIYFAKQNLKRALHIIQVFFIADVVVVILLGQKIWWAYFYGTFLLCFLIIIYIGTKKKYNNNRPQIIISEDGIETEKTPFFSWKNISGEDVDYFYGRNNSGEFFIYDYPAGTERVLIRNLETNRKDLKELLSVYRQEYVKKHGSS
jgi:hypothetical protein